MLAGALAADGIILEQNDETDLTDFTFGEIFVCHRDSIVQINSYILLVLALIKHSCLPALRHCL